MQEPPPMYDGKGYAGPQMVPALPPFPYTENGQSITSSDSTEGTRSSNARPDVLILDGVSYTSTDRSTSGHGGALTRPSMCIEHAYRPVRKCTSDMFMTQICRILMFLTHAYLLSLLPQQQTRLLQRPNRTPVLPPQRQRVVSPQLHLRRHVRE